MSDDPLTDLAGAPLRWFREWPNQEIPAAVAGVYTIWNESGEFVYVGMSGRNVSPELTKPNRPFGLVTRLHSHAQGRRSGDQFCVYVAHRFVLPSLTQEDIAGISSARHSMDAYVRKYIHEHLGYRFIVRDTGAEAREIEARIRRGEWLHGRPLLNPNKNFIAR